MSSSAEEEEASEEDEEEGRLRALASSECFGRAASLLRCLASARGRWRRARCFFLRRSLSSRRMARSSGVSLAFYLSRAGSG